MSGTCTSLENLKRSKDGAYVQSYLLHWPFVNISVHPWRQRLGGAKLAHRSFQLPCLAENQFRACLASRCRRSMRPQGPMLQSTGSPGQHPPTKDASRMVSDGVVKICKVRFPGIQDHSSLHHVIYRADLGVSECNIRQLICWVDFMRIERFAECSVICGWQCWRDQVPNSRTHPHTRSCPAEQLALSIK